MNKRYLVLFLVLILILVFTTFFTTKSSFVGIKIPNVVHKIFINDHMSEIPIHGQVNTAMKTWQTLNPGYTLKIWYGNDCRNYLLRNFGQSHLDCFDNLIPYAYKTDFMRYCILYNEGGWYSDWQQVLLVPLNTFKNYSWVSCWDTTGEENKTNGCMQNGFIGAMKGNRVLKECINSVIDNCKHKNYGKSPWYPTGPCLLGDTFRKYNNLSDVKLGNTQNDPRDGPCFFIDSVKVVINKCCIDIDKPGTVFQNGNDYLSLWKNKNIFKGNP